MLNEIPHGVLLAFAIIAIIVIVYLATSSECCLTRVKFGPVSMQDAYSLYIHRDDIAQLNECLTQYIPIPPSNTSRETAKEIKQIYHDSTHATQDEILQAKHWDVVDGILEYCEQNGLSTAVECGDTTLLASHATLLLTVLSLKIHYNRARPYQLAGYIGIPLSPITLSTTPSYPSGHTASAYYLAWQLGKKYPDHAERLETLAARISHSRIVGAWHYPSDVVAGVLCAKYFCDVYANA